MKVLIADNQPSCRRFPPGLCGAEPTQVSRMAVGADGSPECILARELRRILDGCPICMGDFRDHTYSLLATLAMNEKADGVARLAQLLRCMRDGRWHDVLGFRQWIAYADTLVVFAFRCDKGRVGIVSVFSPADSAAPDEPLHFTTLSLEEAKKLVAIIDSENWIPLTVVSGPYLLEA